MECRDCHYCLLWANKETYECRWKPPIMILEIMKKTFGIKDEYSISVNQTITRPNYVCSFWKAKEE